MTIFDMKMQHFIRFLVLLGFIITSSELFGQKVAELDVPWEPWDSVSFRENIGPYFDSTTNLVTYIEVVEQSESASDSLYARAIDFCCSLNGDLILQKINRKLISSLKIPAYYYDRNNIKRNAGQVQFLMTILVKEGRYRYQISFITILNGSNGSMPIEYALRLDSIIKNAEKDIASLIIDFKDKMREPIVVDEDDW